MRIKSLFATLVASVCLPVMANTITLYSNNFETNAAGFTGLGLLQGTQGYATFGYGQQFLRNTSGGPSILNLNLANSVSNATLNMGLAIIDSWDGNSPSSWGPDMFNVVVDGNLVFSRSFVWTGAATTDPALSTKAYNVQLGFSSYGDAAYLMNLNLGNLSAGAHTISFFANGLGWQGGADESFGIDNVIVKGDVDLPEPASFALMLPGLVAMGAAIRRRRKSGDLG